jgi:hypothetical protein
MSSQYDAGPMPNFGGSLDDANRSLYAPSQPQQQPRTWADIYPYAHEGGMGMAPGGLSPQAGSMYSPNEQRQKQYPQAVAPMTVIGGGGSEDDGGAANAANAERLGQGVLAASQAATSGGMMGGGKKKKKPEGDDAGGSGLSSGGFGGGSDVGGSGGFEGF